MKLQKRFRHAHYFYYGQLLDGVDANASILGITYRTSIPLVCGCVAGVFAVILNFPRLPRFYGLATGFLTSFLCVWPAILCPEQINPPNLNDRVRLLNLMRLMFVVLYSTAGFLGGELASLLFQMTSRFGHISVGAWIDPRGIITNLISTFLAFLFVVVVVGGMKKIWHRIIQQP